MDKNNIIITGNNNIMHLKGSADTQLRINQSPSAMVLNVSVLIYMVLNYAKIDKRMKIARSILEVFALPSFLMTCLRNRKVITEQ